MHDSFDFNRLCTPAQYAAIVKMNRKTIYQWIKEGKAPAHEVICGRVYLYRPGQEPHDPR